MSFRHFQFALAAFALAFLSMAGMFDLIELSTTTSFGKVNFVLGAQNSNSLPTGSELLVYIQNPPSTEAIQAALAPVLSNYGAKAQPQFPTKQLGISDAGILVGFWTVWAPNIENYPAIVKELRQIPMVTSAYITPRAPGQFKPAPPDRPWPTMKPQYPKLSEEKLSKLPRIPTQTIPAILPTNSNIPKRIVESTRTLNGQS